MHYGDTDPHNDRPLPGEHSPQTTRQVSEGGSDICPDCGGKVFWSEEAQDWLHEASDSSCFLAQGRVV